MAIKTITILEDDLDGTEAEETITFTIDGVTYEIDLNATHAEELRTAIAPYAKAGRKTKGSTRRSKRPGNQETQINTAEVREWAKKQGLPVSGRGRVQADIIEKYKATTE